MKVLVVPSALPRARAVEGLEAWESRHEDWADGAAKQSSFLMHPPMAAPVRQAAASSLTSQAKQIACLTVTAEKHSKINLLPRPSIPLGTLRRLSLERLHNFCAAHKV